LKFLRTFAVGETSVYSIPFVDELVMPSIEQ